MDSCFFISLSFLHSLPPLFQPYKPALSPPLFPSSFPKSFLCPFLPPFLHPHSLPFLPPSLSPSFSPSIIPPSSLFPQRRCVPIRDGRRHLCSTMPCRPARLLVLGGVASTGSDSVPASAMMSFMSVCAVAYPVIGPLSTPRETASQRVCRSHLCYCP